MTDKSFLIPIKSYTDDLPSVYKDVVEKAKQMTYKSYAPYSNFSVGAAIELDDGTIIEGANQENAAYPSGTCAERTAAFSAGSLHPGKAFTRIAIAARTEDGSFQRRPISPCGACRQVLAEYEKLAGHPVEVILYGADETYVLPSIATLLPLSFTEF